MAPLRLWSAATSCSRTGGILFIFERPVEGQLVMEYTVHASTLVFTLAGERWLTATRVRR